MRRVDQEDSGLLAPDGRHVFREFVVQCPLPPEQINRRLVERGIIGGLDISEQAPNGMLICVTEVNSREEIEGLASALAEVSRGG